MKRLVLAVVAAGLVLAASACSQRAPGIVVVGEDADSIAAAVAHAVPGDLILIPEGTYHEEIDVDVPDITIRGLDRNGVVLDGQDTIRNAFKVTADGVTIENLTIHSYRLNGIIFTGSGGLGHFDNDYRDAPSKAPDGSIPHLERFKVAYVTSYNNGLYGIYAFQSRNGVIEDSYASGHPDSGLYVGQCDPCNTVVDRVTMENNAIGYYGTNASGNVYVVNSLFTGNRLGMTPNSQLQELLSPQRETYVVGNVVTDNDNPNTPPVARGFFGGGIAVGGGASNYIARNYVAGHDVYGIGVVELNPFDPTGNTIEGNVVENNTVDILFLPNQTATSSEGNCFAGNTFGTSAPEGIEQLYPCDGADHPFTSFEVLYPRAPQGVDYRSMPTPPAQPTMPGDLRAVPDALPAQPAFPDIDAITVPTP